MYYKDQANNVENDNLRSFFGNSINKWMNNLDNQLDDVKLNNKEWDIIEVNTNVINSAKFIILKWKNLKFEK